MGKLLTLASGVASCIVLLTVMPTRAQTPDDIELSLPRHDAVCVNGTVSKRKLAGILLAGTKNSDAVQAAFNGPDSWRLIFTDDNFCRAPLSCAKNPDNDVCKAVAKCSLAKSVASQAANRFFASLNSEVKKQSDVYTESHSLAAYANNLTAQVARYFADERNDVYSIACGRGDIPKVAAPFDPTKDPILSNMRVRGLSDELYIDRSQYTFKGTTSATGNFSGDTSAAHTYTSKIIGAFGYALGATSEIQVVPYGSIYQSLTDTALKPRVFDPNDNVAGGFLAQSSFDYDGVSHVFSVKPQYLLYTSNQAELASLRAIYTPTMAIPFNINTFTRLEYLPGSPWWQFTFNLRSDTGTYANRGNTPAVVAVNEDFERAGAQVGFALSTDGVANLPSVTLIVTETYLYGFSGFYRHLDLFQSSLTYNITNSYVGLTASYKHGRDEDTAVSSQIWLIGLSGHY